MNSAVTRFGRSTLESQDVANSMSRTLFCLRLIAICTSPREGNTSFCINIGGYAINL